MSKAIVTCSVTGVLTNPEQHPVPVTPAQMAASAKEAYDAGASIMHIHFRDQRPGMGYLPTWDPGVAAEVSSAIRAACPGVILNFTTGVMGDDISGPLACLEACGPETAALNAGSLNYLKVRRNGQWAWPPMMFANPLPKIEGYLKVFYDKDILPECECFDTGIVRSVDLLARSGTLKGRYTISLVMGVASGMPARADLLPILIDEMPDGAHWQSVVIGRDEVWRVHERTAELGGHLRTGVEDTFYLPDGSRTSGNGQLIDALVCVARERGRTIASPAEARAMLGLAEAARAEA